jgi:hypothetical protein
MYRRGSALVMDGATQPQMLELEAEKAKVEKLKSKLLAANEQSSALANQMIAGATQPQMPEIEAEKAKVEVLKSKLIAANRDLEDTQNLVSPNADAEIVRLKVPAPLVGLGVTTLCSWRGASVGPDEADEVPGSGRPRSENGPVGAESRGHRGAQQRCANPAGLCCPLAEY